MLRNNNDLFAPTIIPTETRSAERRLSTDTVEKVGGANFVARRGPDGIDPADFLNRNFVPQI